MKEEASPPTTAPAGTLDYEQARLAYSIIQSLLDHTRVVNDLIALMAQIIGEEAAKALTNTPHWQAYLDSRRQMERTRADMEKFTEMMNKLGDDRPDSQNGPAGDQD